MTTLGIRCVILFGLVPGVPLDAVEPLDEPRAARSVYQSGRPLPVLLTLLKSGTVAERIGAARELGERGEEARPAIPELLEASRAAPGRLGMQGDLGVQATIALCRIGGPEATARVRELMTSHGRSKSPSSNMAQFGEAPVPQYLDLVLDPQFQATALSLLGRRRGEAVPVLARALDDASPQTRALAALGLGFIPPDERKPALPRLLKVLDDKDVLVRLRAAAAVWRAERKAERVVPVFLAVMRDDNEEMRAQSLEYLSELEAGAAPAAPAMVEAMGDASERVCRLAMLVLTRIGPAAVPDVLLGLREGNEQRRLCALSVLPSIRARPQDVTGALLATLEAESAAVRVEAARTLTLLVPARRADAVRVLAQALANPAVAPRAASLLGWIGPDARAAVPALHRQLGQRDLALAMPAARALLTIDPTEHRTILPVLDLGLRSDKSEIRFLAIDCLKEIGLIGRDFLPALLEGLRLSIQDPDRADPEQVMELIVKVDGGTAAIPLLLRTLTTANDGSERYLAGECLNLLGEEVVPALEAIAHGGDPLAQRIARHSLESIKNRATK